MSKKNYYLDYAKKDGYEKIDLLFMFLGSLDYMLKSNEHYMNDTDRINDIREAKKNLEEGLEYLKHK